MPQVNGLASPNVAISETVVVGVDAGGTTSRAVLAAADGTRLAEARGEGVNPRSSGGDPSLVLASLLAQLCSADRLKAGRVTTGVLGLAGAGAAGLATAQGAADAAWRAAGLRGEPVVVPDIEVAFASGSPRPDGAVLVAGTGAGAGLVRDGRLVHRADGHGWLLGDGGSAVWLGIRAVRSVMADLDGRAEPTALTSAVLRSLDVLVDGHVPGDRPARTLMAQAVIAAADAVHPAQFGTLAPLVSAAAVARDPVATQLAHDAVTELLGTLAAVMSADGAGAHAATVDEVVLAGSVLLSPGPVRDGVRAGVRQRWGMDATDAGDGAGGAALLALRRSGEAVDDVTFRRLTRPDRWV